MAMIKCLWITCILWSCLLSIEGSKEEIDGNGYLVYCPCMGRFGNQADHFLGSLSFAHAINRTLILPPWIEYERGKPRSIQIPFDRYFRVNPLKSYHRVITMEKFMADLAPTIWPEGKRTVFCYGPRDGPRQNDCNAKEGNPFGSFWDTFDIEFDRSEFYGRDLSYDTRLGDDLAEMWRKRYPPETHPVLAFAGAPAVFPVNERDKEWHRYLEWSEMIDEKAKKFVETVLPAGPFVGVHLRNDLDWDNVCTHVTPKSHLFASPQCLGYRMEHGELTEEICQPSKSTIVEEIVRVVKATEAKSIFVASDRDHMIDEIDRAVKKFGAKAYRRYPDEPQVSLAILGRSTHFIGNCVSSFSAFVKRERDAKGLESSFFGFKNSMAKRKEESSKGREDL